MSRVVGAGRSVLVIGLLIAPISFVLPLVGQAVPGPVAALAWALVIFKVGFDSVVMMSFRQHVTPPRLLGRVNGTLRVMFSGALTVGAAVAAVVGDLSGPRTATWVACAALALVWVPILRSPMRRATLDGCGLTATRGRREPPSVPMVGRGHRIGSPPA
ncbi:hypothetical protein ABGB07_45290 [Micromonosporaceae bacterium B7E4]